MQRPGKITLSYMSLYSEESTVFLNPFGLFKTMILGTIQLEGKHAIMFRVHQNRIQMWLKSHSVHSSASEKKYVNIWRCRQCSIQEKGKRKERCSSEIILFHVYWKCRPWVGRHSFTCSFTHSIIPWFSISGDLFSRGIDPCLKIFLVGTSGEGGSATGVLWIVTKGAVKYPTIHRAAACNK